MKQFVLFIAAALLLAGCASNQLAQLQSAEQEAQKIYAATTQATANAQAALVNAPAGSPATQAVATAEQAEQNAKATLDAIEAALSGAQSKDTNAAAIAQAISAALAAVPSPWTAVLASLIPAAVPLVVSAVQSVKLGKVQQTVQSFTQELEAHKAALAALGAPVETPSNTIPPGNAARHA
jgi:uncharacterized protein YceK